MAIDFDQPIGRVRLLTADFDESALILTDEMITAYLDMNDGNQYRAAADALDAMATSEVLLSKVVRTQDLATDGPKVAADLRGKAAALRAKADREDEDAGSFFEFVPFYPTGKPEGAEWRLP